MLISPCHFWTIKSLLMCGYGQHHELPKNEWNDLWLKCPILAASSQCMLKFTTVSIVGKRLLENKIQWLFGRQKSQNVGSEVQTSIAGKPNLKFSHCLTHYELHNNHCQVVMNIIIGSLLSLTLPRTNLLHLAIMNLINSLTAANLMMNLLASRLPLWVPLWSARLT